MSHSFPETSPVLQPKRLRALRMTGLLDSPPEKTFDQLIQLTARIMKTPVALISLVDECRQFFKAQCGLPEPIAATRETPLSHSFCKHVVISGEALLVEDASTHPLVRDNPAVIGLGVRAYAGIPLSDADGNVLGALCAIDSKPRQWTHDEIENLRALADQTIIEIALATDNWQMKQDAEDRRQMIRLDQHDLRTPLNALMLNLQLISASGELNTEQQECVDHALRSGELMSTIINQMLDSSNIEHRGPDALAPREMHPMELIAPALNQVIPQASEKGIIITTSAQVATGILADPDKIVRVLVNLLANAIKFTAAGGRVELTAEDCLEAGHAAVRFIVRDTGLGIAPQDIHNIFEEGYRVDKGAPTGRSTGLGLTFCQRVVEAHGGEIRVQSVPKEGSVFSFWLPCSKALPIRD